MLSLLRAVPWSKIHYFLSTRDAGEYSAIMEMSSAYWILVGDMVVLRKKVTFLFMLSDNKVVYTADIQWQNNVVGYTMVNPPLIARFMGPIWGPMNFAIWVFKIQLILHSVPLWVMLGVFYEFKVKDPFHEQFFHRNSNLMENLVSV